MLPLHKTLYLDGTPLSLTPVGDELLLLDNNYTFYYLDKESLTLKKTKKIQGLTEKLHAYYKGSQGQNGMIHLPVGASGSSALLEVGEGVVKKATLAWHSAHVEAAAFSPDGVYVATGGQDGRVYIHQVASGKLVASLPSRPDTISALQFSSCGRHLAAASFDKSLVVFDIDRNVLTAHFKTESVVEALTFFSEGDDRLFAVCREGCSAIVGLPVGEEPWIEEQNSFSDWPSVLEKSEGERIAVVGSRSSKLYFMRLDANSVIHDISLFKRGVTLLKVLDNHLFIGYDDGTIEVMQNDRSLNDFSVAMRLKNYEEARKLLVKQPFLFLNREFDSFDAAWERVKKQVREHLINRRFEQARKVVQPFIYDPVYKKEFDALMGSKHIIIRFLDAIHFKDFKSAYAIANKNPEIHTLQSFIDLENHWHKSFKKARTMLVSNPGVDRKHVEHVLKPFMKVPGKKEVIESLLQDFSVCTDAKRLIQCKEFAAFFELCEKHRFLKEGELYRNIFPMIEKVFLQVEKLEEESCYDEAMALLEKVLDLAPFADRSLTVVERIREKKMLLESIENDNLVDSYRLIELSPILVKSPEFKVFQSDFIATTEKALHLAFRGDTKGVLDMYDDHLPVDYLQYKIAAVVKVACLYEIREALAQKKQVNWPGTIEAYVQRFGKDGEIKRICGKGRLKEILDSLPITLSPNGYLKHGFPDSILVE